MRGACISPIVSIVTGGILQAEAGLVALSHRVLSVGIQQVVVAELIHAVKMPVDQQKSGRKFMEQNKPLPAAPRHHIT